MNKYQKSILITYSLLVTLMVVYPPFDLVLQGRTLLSEHSVLWEPIRIDEGRGRENVYGTINTSRLYIQLVATSLVSGALTLAFKDSAQ